VLISFFAIVSCIYVLTSTSLKLIGKKKPHFEVLGLIVSGVDVIGAGTLAYFKFVLARRLKSQTLFLDALTSAFIATLAVFYIASELMLHFVWDLWAVEHVASLTIGTLFLCYAAYNLSRADHNGEKWYKPGFWQFERFTFGPFRPPMGGKAH